MLTKADMSMIVGEFLEAETDAVSGRFEWSAALHDRFLLWAKRKGHAPWTRKLLITELRGFGFTDGKSNGNRGLKGLRLKPLQESEGTTHG